MPSRILVTGGAGFIGSSVCLAIARRHPDWEIVACDNLYRRGSELNLPRLREAGISFVHADVRSRDDLAAIGPITALVECSAEPSVMASVGGASDYVVQTNLVGAYHCLEFAATHGAQMIFLSTSRVYPVAGLAGLAYDEGETRFELRDEQPVHGASTHGIAEGFPLDGARTLYGTTKLAAELLVAEYADAHGIRATINRCGVVAGPWQMGKVDQGVFTHWMISHYLRRDLSYIGFDGTGKQVRDLLHIDDLVDLVEQQLLDPEGWAGRTFNVGGGRDISLSLLETTAICEELTGHRVGVGSVAETRPGDVPVYLSDCRSIAGAKGWAPSRDARTILTDIFDWISDHESLVRSTL